MIYLIINATAPFYNVIALRYLILIVNIESINNEKI